MTNKLLLLGVLLIGLCPIGSSDLYAQNLTTEGPPAISGGAEAAVSAAKILSVNEVADMGFLFGQTAHKLSPQPLVLQSAKVDKSFEGFGFDDNPTENSGFRFIPPDPSGAAGKSRVIAVVNTMIEARNKGGHLKWRDALSDFFAPLSPTTFTFDPKIVYDQYEDRFVVVTLELVVGSASMDPGNISRILLAVSKDGSPKTPTAADWHYHAISSKDVAFGSFDTFADYPGFEVDEEAVYITANMFTIVPFGFFGGVRLWIVDKGAGSGGFYDGGAAAASSALDPYASAGIATTTMPAQVFGAGGVGSGIGTYLVSYSGLTDTVDEFVQVVRVDDPLGTPTFTQEFVNIGSIEALPPFFALPDAPQAGTTFLIEVNDRRALDAVWRDNMLWLTTTINPESGPNAGQTTAHWFKLNTSAVTSSASPANLITLDQQGNIGGEDIATGTHTFFPAVAVNRNGEAKFGFSASAASIFAGAFVAGRQPGDAPGTVQGSETVKAGKGPYKRFFGGTRNRWGDYSGISVDPSNDKFFWVFNEFADTPGSPGVGSAGPEDGRWGTAWARCKFQGGKSRVVLAGTMGTPEQVEVADLPQAFSLGPNYPNPFNPTTTITFALPDESAVQVAVYDVLGRQVQLLADGALPAGEHAVTFEAQGLPSGLYLVRMVTPQGTFTRTMQLVK